LTHATSRRAQCERRGALSASAIPARTGDARSRVSAKPALKTGIRFVREFAPLLASASSERNPNELRFLDPVRWLSEGEASTFLIAYEL
jgi:hypothetical protein